MALGTTLLNRMADSLERAEANRSPIEAISMMYPQMDLKDAYQIQWIGASRAVRAQRRLLGYKIGLTSRAAQKHFQVFEPDYGHLFDHMELPVNAETPFNRLIQPMIEGEIAFVLGRDLKGPGIGVAEAIRAVDFATAAFEIIDSRIKDWKITARDTIADNGSSALYMLSGTRRSIEGLDLAHLGMALWKNGEVVQSAAGAAVMDNPINALVFLANHLASHDRGLLAGQVVLSGSLSGMIKMNRGEQYELEIKQLGRLSTYCQGEARS